MLVGRQWRWWKQTPAVDVGDATYVVGRMPDQTRPRTWRKMRTINHRQIDIKWKETLIAIHVNNNGHMSNVTAVLTQSHLTRCDPLRSYYQHHKKGWKLEKGTTAETPSIKWYMWPAPSKWVACHRNNILTYLMSIKLPSKWYITHVYIVHTVRDICV